MAAATGVRTDYTSSDLREFARRCSDPDQVRRLLALALIVDGGSRSDAARFAGVTLQIVRDWVLRFNEGGPDGLATRKAPGRASILNDAQRARLVEQVGAGPIPAAHGVVPGGLLIWRSGSGMSSRFPRPSIPWGASFARWDIANVLRDHGITGRSPMALSILR
jgi:hypothetical protein